MKIWAGPPAYPYVYIFSETKIWPGIVPYLKNFNSQKVAYVPKIAIRSVNVASILTNTIPKMQQFPVLQQCMLPPK